MPPSVSRRRAPDSGSPRIRLPVIESLLVSGYALFPGKELAGLRCDFSPGVTAVVGINGIGKTTLLNICFRMLSGPKDWRNRQPGQAAGGRPITLTEWRDSSFFKSRVPDAALRASARAQVSIGSHTLILTRSLRTLAVEEFILDGKAQTADQKKYEDVVAKLCGLASFEDFFLLLRYLTFFLEDRAPLLWDVGAQREVLRALFFDNAAAERGRHLFQEIQKLDSRFRNRQDQLSSMEKEFFGAEMSRTADSRKRDQIAELHRAARGAVGRASAADSKLYELARELERRRLALEQAKVALAENQRLYAEAEEARFADLVGRADQLEHAPAVFVAHALSGTGCMVCGSRANGVQERLQERIAARTCPFCAAPESEQELRRVRRVAGADLNATDAGVQRCLEAVTSLAVDLEDVQGQYVSALAESQSAAEQVNTLRLRLEKLGAALPVDSKQQRELQTAMKVLREQLQEMRAELARRSREYETLLGLGEERIRRFATKIQSQFETFAGYFLAEKCDLLYDTERLRVGQGSQTFEFPRFQARMTSAGAPSQPSPRESATEVSESQKEFLDLAFRMALLDAVGGNSPVELILETPEASLDAVFTVRAGELLGLFAGRNGNRVIATSNLTNGGMIAALFGAARLPGDTSSKHPSHYVVPAKRWPRVIDLIHSAAENAAIRKYRETYDVALREAVEPENAAVRT